MKRILLANLIVLLVFVQYTAAQIDRSQPPKGGPAPVINIAEPATFTLKNGLQVFVVEDHSLPRVAFNLVLNIEAIQEGDKAGYVSMAGNLMRSGTSSRTKSEIDEAVDYIGATLSTSSTGLYASALKKHMDTLLMLMTDVLYNPVFPQEEFEKLHKRLLSSIAASKDDPDYIAGNVTNVLYYGQDHPYGELTTEATLGNIEVQDCRAYYEKYFTPSIAYLAIVGDVSNKEAKKIAKEYFGRWEAKSIDLPAFAATEPPKRTSVAIVDRPNSVQSEIRIGYPITLRKGHPDVLKLSILNRILGGGSSGRLFKNIREDKGYTYGAYSSIDSDQIVGNFTASMSVRNEVTDSAIHEALYEMQEIVNDQVTEYELMAAKAETMGQFARSLESPQTIASFALNVARYNLPKDYYTNYLKRAEAVDVVDLQEVGKRYIKPQQSWLVVVGKAADVAGALERFGPVSHFDIYGNPYTPEEISIPVGLSAADVLNDYIEAIGGKEAIDGVQDISMTYSGDLQGRELKIEVFKKSPAKNRSEISMGGMTVIKQVFDGESAKIEQMGQIIELTEAQQKNLRYDASIVPELYVLEHGLAADLVGAESIEGKRTYVVEVTKPSGDKETNYYDIETGLKVRSTELMDTPQGKMAQNSDYGTYQSVEGMLVPTEISLPLGPGSVYTTMTNADANTGLDDNIFDVD